VACTKKRLSACAFTNAAAFGWRFVVEVVLKFLSANSSTPYQSSNLTRRPDVYYHRHSHLLA
jgi:hypothetical protein